MKIAFAQHLLHRAHHLNGRLRAPDFLQQEARDYAAASQPFLLARLAAGFARDVGAPVRALLPRLPAGPRLPAPGIQVTLPRATLLATAALAAAGLRLATAVLLGVSVGLAYASLRLVGGHWLRVSLPLLNWDMGGVTRYAAQHPSDLTSPGQWRQNKQNGPQGAVQTIHEQMLLDVRRGLQVQVALPEGAPQAVAVEAGAHSEDVLTQNAKQLLAQLTDKDAAWQRLVTYASSQASVPDLSGALMLGEGRWRLGNHIFGPAAKKPAVAVGNLLPAQQLRRMLVASLFGGYTNATITLSRAQLRDPTQRQAQAVRLQLDISLGAQSAAAVREYLKWRVPLAGEPEAEAELTRMTGAFLARRQVCHRPLVASLQMDLPRPNAEQPWQPQPFSVSLR